MFFFPVAFTQVLALTSAFPKEIGRTKKRGKDSPLPFSLILPSPIWEGITASVELPPSPCRGTITARAELPPFPRSGSITARFESTFHAQTLTSSSRSGARLFTIITVGSVVLVVLALYLYLPLLKLFCPVIWPKFQNC